MEDRKVAQKINLEAFLGNEELPIFNEVYNWVLTEANSWREQAERQGDSQKMMMMIDNKINHTANVVSAMVSIFPTSGCW